MENAKEAQDQPQTKIDGGLKDTKVDLKVTITRNGVEVPHGAVVFFVDMGDDMLSGMRGERVSRLDMLNLLREVHGRIPEMAANVLLAQSKPV